MKVVQLHPHLTSGTLAAYVTGALDDEVSRAVERHVLVCPPCAEALACEASFEEALHALAIAPPAAATCAADVPPPRPGPTPIAAQGPAPRLARAHRRTRIAGAVAAAVAMAASVLLFVSSAPADEPVRASVQAGSSAAFAEGAGVQMATSHPLDGG